MPQLPPADAPRSVTDDGSEEGSAGSLPEYIGPYRIESILGRGGMGEVYRAFDPRLQRHVAVKRILAERQSARARARFWREARALAALRHPGFVAIYDIGEDVSPAGTTLYLAMELVDGAPLRVARLCPWPAAATVALGVLVARALATAHGAGIIHRDVKPSNILVQPDGAVRVIDFGLARRSDDDHEGLTAQGALIGTLSFMAPEQVLGEAVTPATDVFALGAVLYALLAGAAPHARPSDEATAAAILAGARLPIAEARADLPAIVAGWIERCLAREPVDRPTAGELADGFTAIAAALHWSSGPDAVRQGLAALANAAPRAALGDPTRRPSTRPSRADVAARRGLRRGWWLVGFVVSGGVAAAAVGQLGQGAGAGVEAEAGREVPAFATSAGPVAGAAAMPPPGADRDAARDSTPRGTTSARLEALRGITRKVVAVLPFTGSDDATRALGAIVADGLREYLTLAPEEVASVPLTELAARAPGGDMAALTSASLALAPGSSGGVDVVVAGEVRREASGARVTVTLVLPGAAHEALTALTVVVDGAARDPLALARALAEETYRAVGVKALPALPTLTHSGAAWRALMDARQASFLGHERALRRELALALASDPALAEGLLLRARVHADNGHGALARGALEAFLVRAAAATPRDRSLAAVLALDLAGKGMQALHALEAHLVQWPRDLEARLDLLRRKFVGVGRGTLRQAADLADSILQIAPATPYAASKLARAYAWLGQPDEARRRLEALGLTPTTPGMAAVFGEIALYAKRYAEAIVQFDAAREDDGQRTFYAANMRIAAEMLRGSCWDAATTAVGLLNDARLGGDGPGSDWTYFLYYNALVCAERLDDARIASERWAARTGQDAAAIGYRAWRWDVELLAGRDAAAVVAEAMAIVRRPSPDSGPRVMALQLLARIGPDAKVLRQLGEELARELLGSLDREADAVGPYLARLQRALVARADLIEGRNAVALATLEELQRPGAWEIEREGDLFEKTRWTRVYAEALDRAGKKAEAEVVWRRILDLGYERLLVMDVTVAARRRLAAR